MAEYTLFCTGPLPAVVAVLLRLNRHLNILLAGLGILLCRRNLRLLRNEILRPHPSWSRPKSDDVRP